MVIAAEGTFDYRFEVVGKLAGPIKGRLREPVGSGDRRLVGHTPVLEATEYQREPWQLYARITLTPSDRGNATVSAVSFSVERGLIRVLQRGDLLHISRTRCGGIGLSIIRDAYLVAAAGAITHVPLGADVSIRYPMDLIQQAEAIFRSRDPEYHLPDHPIEVSIAGETRILHRGRTIGPYEIFVRHGFLLGMPGTDACASIERRGVCPETAAHTSAQLLEEERLKIER